MTNTMPERAASGRQQRRAFHELIAQAPRVIQCSYCGARPGTQCAPGGGYHMARFARAAIQGLMAAEEFKVVLGDLDVFTGATVIRDDPELVALRADYPGWEVWRRQEDGVYCAWLVLSQPPKLLRAGSVAELRAALERETGGKPDAS